jgi:hypothetical protein
MPRLQPKELFETLLHADTEAEVVEILTEAEYWDDPTVWRYYGDEAENWPTVGNQQSRPDHALVEKLTNAGDTKLIAAAVIGGIPIEGQEAPQTMADARDLLFGPELKNVEELSKSITVAATGKTTGRKQKPSITIVDDGEGRTPASMPDTILSLHKSKSNKGRIPFVQGKFNMGGSGVLEFCGIEHNVQLILSHRNPELLGPDATPQDKLWSFTVVRRHDPDPELPRSSRFVYLAPGAPDAKGLGTLLTFDADTMPIFPDKNQAYVRHSVWGTLFKLYEYGTRSVTNMMLEDGLMMRLRLLLPEPALPIRFHECRPYGGHSGSFDTTMAGLIYTLEQDRKDPKSQNVEWFDKTEIDIDGAKFGVRIYLFKKPQKRDKSSKSGKWETKNPIDSYRSDEGILFTYNGQCHAIMSKDFFRRGRVNQDYLWNSLLVFVDCTEISVRTHEKLFMANREQLRQGPLKVRLVEELEGLLHDHQELKRLAEERRKGEISDNPQTSQSFDKFIDDMVKRHPLLEEVLGPGFRIANPWKPRLVEAEEKSWQGKRFPDKFHLRGLDPGKPLTREAFLDSKVRVLFETDAENEYFKRDEQPGQFKLFQVVGGKRVPATNWGTPSLFDGTATLTITALPPDAEKGHILTYEAETTDPSRVEPFINRFTLVVQGQRKAHSGGKNKEKKHATEKQGKDAADDTRLNTPKPQEVWEETWADHEPVFDRMTAMRIKSAPDGGFDYYINMDNVFLRQVTKAQSRRAKEFRDRFKFGLTMISLAMIRHDLEIRKREQPKVDDDGEAKPTRPDVRDLVADVTTAIAPFFLPLIDALSSVTGLEPLSASAGEVA